MISLFFHIIQTSILPILLLILGGYIMDRKFGLDLRTLSKLNFYILLPCFIFKALYEANFDESSWQITLAATIVILLGNITAQLLGKLAGFEQNKIEIVKNAMMFNNGGNIGLAIITFIYSNDPFLVNGKPIYLELAITAVVSTVVIQNLSCNTLGFYQAGRGRLTAKDALSLVAHMPTIYIVPSALILRQIESINLTLTPIWPVFQFFGQAFVGVALITLGVQICRTPLNFFQWDVLLATSGRLVFGPFLAIIAIETLGALFGTFKPIASEVLIIVYSVPTAINTALMAYEMKNNPEYATKIVMSTTVLSAFTMPLFILLAYYLYPLN